MKVEATEVEGRKVYSVRAFNNGVATWLNRLPTLWVEGEITELRRQDRWASVFFTLKDPEDGACLSAQMPRGQFDALRLDLKDGERVHVFGRPELYEQRGELRLKVLTIERYGVGAHLAALERLKHSLAAEGLFAADRKRALPRFPRLIGLVTGNDAAAQRVEERLARLRSGIERQRDDALRSLEDRAHQVESSLRERLHEIATDAESERAILESRLQDLQRRLDELSARSSV